MDQLIVSTEIPTIVHDLRGTSGFVWIGGAYLLANAAAAPIWVKLSDIWGRKAVLLTVVLWFAAASVTGAVIAAGFWGFVAPLRAGGRGTRV